MRPLCASSRVDALKKVFDPTQARGNWMLTLGEKRQEKARVLSKIGPKERAVLQGVIFESMIGGDDLVGAVQTLLKLSEGQVRAIKAWLRIAADVLPERTALQIPSHDFMKCYGLSKRRSLVPDLLEVQEGDLRPLIEPILGRWCEFELIRAALIAYENKLLSLGEDRADRRRVTALQRAKRGDEVSYRSEIKASFRRVRKDFILRRSTPGMIASGEALDLASRYPEPDIGLYRQAGIASERLHVVEGGSASAQLDCARRCSLSGARVALMRLEEVLPYYLATGTRFAYADLDLIGPYSRSSSVILKALPLADRALVIVNLLGKRENRFALDAFSKHHREAEIVALMNSAQEKSALYGGSFRTLDWRSEDLNKKIDRVVESQPSLRDIRSSRLDTLILQQVASASATVIHSHRPWIPLVSKLLREGAVLGLSISDLFLEVQSRLSALLVHPYAPPRHDQDLNSYGLGPVHLAEDVLLSAPKVAHLEKYWYRSSFKNARFYTLMAEVHSGKELPYDNWHRSAKFFLDAALAIVDEMNGKTDPLKFRMLGPDNRPRPIGSVVTLNDKVELLSGSSLIAQIPYRSLLRDTVDYLRWLKEKYPAASWSYQSELPRRQITSEGVGEPEVLDLVEED